MGDIPVMDQKFTFLEKAHKFSLLYSRYSVSVIIPARYCLFVLIQELKLIIIAAALLGKYYIPAPVRHSDSLRQRLSSSFCSSGNGLHSEIIEPVLEIAHDRGGFNILLNLSKKIRLFNKWAEYTNEQPWHIVEDK